MPRSTTGELHTRAAWFRLLLTNKWAGRTRLRLSEELTVRYGTHEVTVPVGAELVFFWHLTGYVGTTKPFRTEGIFYFEDGRTLSIRGYYGRKMPKDREREYHYKTVELKDPPAHSTFDAIRPTHGLALAGL